MNWVIGIVLDIILLAIVVLMFRKGKKDGFAKTVVGFLGFFIAIIIATVVCKPVAEMSYNSFIRTPVKNAIETTIETQVDKIGESVSSADDLFMQIEKSLEKSPAFIRNLFVTDEKKTELASQINQIYTPDAAELAERAADTVVKPLAIPVLSVVTFVLVFFVSYLLCIILSKSLKLVNKIPLLGGLNSLLGGVVGALRGIVILIIIDWALIMFLGNGSNILGILTAETINSSLIIKFLSSINPLTAVFASVISAK